MTESINEFFTPKHKRLDRISSMANIFSWIVLIFYVLQALLQFLQLTQNQGVQSISALFLEYPETAINYILGIFNILLRGVVYWIILKGVSIGLNMILETDLNYREKFQGDNNEQ
jgi:hypothetical protein